MLAELVEEKESLTMKHISMEENSMGLMNSLIKGKVIGTTIHKKYLPFWNEIIINKRSQIINNSFQMAVDGVSSVSNIPKTSMELGLKALFKIAGWNNVSVWHPLVTRGKVMGVVNFWGNGLLRIDDNDILSIFANQIANALETARLYTAESKRAESLTEALAEAQRQAVTDPLTNLYNRYYLYTLGEHEINRAKRFKQPLSLLMVDADHFKEINDTHGHLVGDQVLILIADRFQEITRKVDIIARFGGEEFVILLPETSGEAAFELAERLRSRISTGTFTTNNKTYPLPTISIGIASLGEDIQTLDDLLNHADTALYEAKAAGRNNTVINSVKEETH